MTDHTPATADGAAMYYRVLFPKHGPWRIERIRWPKPHWDHVVDHVSRDGRAQALCRELWNERQRIRAASGGTGEWVTEVHLENSIAGDVRVGVCLDCPWVEWGDWAWTRFEPGRDYRSHHRACLIEERQAPSDRRMCLTMSAADFGLGELGVWYDRFNPQHIRPASYALVGMANRAGGRAHSLWNRREELRRSAAKYEPGTHRGAVVTVAEGKLYRLDGADPIDSRSAWALCLGCMWLKALGETHDHQDWQENGEAAISEHEASPTTS